VTNGNSHDHSGGDGAQIDHGGLAGLSGADHPATALSVSASDRLVGRDTAGAGASEELAVGGGIEFSGSGGIQTSAFTGSVTKEAGGTALTIADEAVTYAKMQNVSATGKLLGRRSAGAGDVEEIDASQALAGYIANADTASTTTPAILIPCPKGGTISAVRVKCGANQTCGATSLIVDIHKIPVANANTDGQGTTMYTTQGNRPTISNSNMYTNATLPDVTTFAAGDYLAVYVDQAGTSVAEVGVEVRFLPNA